MCPSTREPTEGGGETRRKNVVTDPPPRRLTRGPPFDVSATACVCAVTANNTSKPPAPACLILPPPRHEYILYYYNYYYSSLYIRPGIIDYRYYYYVCITAVILYCAGEYIIYLIICNVIQVYTSRLGKYIGTYCMCGDGERSTVILSLLYIGRLENKKIK